jgi:hypothetical protein
MSEAGLSRVASRCSTSLTRSAAGRRSASSVTAHDIASEATWADKWRDSNNLPDQYEHTRRWHYVDLEIQDPDMTRHATGTSRRREICKLRSAIRWPALSARWHNSPPSLGHQARVQRSACTRSNYCCIWSATWRFALGLVRANKRKGSVKTRRKSAGWNPDYLFELLQLKYALSWIRSRGTSPMAMGPWSSR